MSDYSMVEYFAEHDGYKCGYCKSPNTNYSHGMWAHQLSISDYQDLVDRGWRRSGKYCYKPTMDKTCCPMYTIKCSVKDYKLSKSQKKVLKRMNKFLIHGKNEEMKDSEPKSKDNYYNDSFPNDFPDAAIIHVPKEPSEIGINDRASFKFHEDSSTAESEQTLPSSLVNSSENVINQGNCAKPTNSKANMDLDPSKPLCRKAKLIRQERRLEKLAKKMKNGDMEVLKSSKQALKVKTLEDFINESEVENAIHKLQVKLVRSEPQSGDFKSKFNSEVSLYQAYQMIIHQDDPSECSEKSFVDFLVKSPLEEEKSSKLPLGYGSFHQQYFLDGKMIAVGVIDILPNCVSSVYLFYDPDFSFLSLGTYAALREIAFTRELLKMSPELKSYYMGFYIHSCPKMRYKAQYYPSFLLCPETYTWHNYEDCKLKLDKAKYSRLESDIDRIDENGDIMLNEVLILHRRKIKTFPVYCALTGGEDVEEVKQYAGFVGRKCYSKMLLYRS